MTECRRCGGRATDSFLCWPCCKHLTRMLREMPWWLARLTETAIGQTRMSDNAGRKSARRKDLDGDIALAACIEQLPPKEEDLEKARKARERAALAHALATGGINARASELLSEINDSLGYWCRVTCENRGLTYAPRPSTRALAANHAIWLYLNATAIAQSEDADTIIGDIEGHLEDIVRMVNRPLHMIDLGPCPAWDDENYQACGVKLRAPRDTEEVQCRRCKTTHNTMRLLLDLMAAAEREVKPWDELVRINRSLPPDRRVAPRTLQHWRATGLLMPREVDGATPMYSWMDVKRLQMRKPQKASTGAAAHERMG